MGDGQRTAAALDVEVIWAESAETDLRQIHAYVAANNPAAARALTEAIIAAANGLGKVPMKGHAGTGNTREWVVPRFPRYLLIYEIDAPADAVHIARVWHQSRAR